MIDRVVYQGEELAIIIKSDFDKIGIEFVTPNDYSQQLAYMHHSKGHRISPHFHNKVPRTVHYTQEVLVIKKGKIRVDFYTTECKYIESRVLGEGDIILLCSGGHGFEILEEVKMVEVKQGPYIGEEEKTRFSPK